jgi:hypothetical protein
MMLDTPPGDTKDQQDYRSRGKRDYRPRHGELQQAEKRSLVFAGYGGTSCWRGGKDARAVACSGPGSAWQDEMLRQLQYHRMGEAVAGFGQAMKDIADREWLAGQGLGPVEPDVEAG